MKFRKVWIAGVMALLAQGAAAELTNGLYAAFDTTMGSFTCRLDYAEAPLTCANFVGLAEGSQSWVAPQTGGVQADPFYDDLIFHRVITNFMIQGGCPLGNGTSGPGHAIPDEFSTNLTHHSAGVLSMANSGPDSGGSQFFITLKNTDWLDNKHAVFGEVIGGMDVVFDIGSVEVDAGNLPLIDVEMNSIQILRVGDDALAFDPVDQPLPEVSSLNLAITNGVSGIEVVAATSNQCEQTVYSSTNLNDWEFSEQQYSREYGGDWAVPVSTNVTTEFFRGVRVFYPQAATNEIVGHTLTLSLGADTIVLQPEAGGVGSCFYSYNGNSGEITKWRFEPAYCSYFFETTILVDLSFEFHYSTPSNGTYDGFYKHPDPAYGWQPISGTFTDTPPVTE